MKDVIWPSLKLSIHSKLTWRNIFDTFYLCQSDSSKSTSWANRWMFMFRKTWSFLGIQNLTGKKPESTNFSKLVAMSSSKPEPRLIDKNSFLKFQTFNFAINICVKWSIFPKKYILLKKKIFLVKKPYFNLYISP